MSASAKKYPDIKVKDNVAPGERSLYYKNVGLFSDPYLDSLSRTKQSPFILQNWDTEGLPDFSAAYEWMLSTWSEMKDILPNLSEAQLEERWIKPILQRLGWEYEVQDRMKKWGKTEIPDYSLFESKKAYIKAQGCKTDEAYFEHVLAVADAKQMGISLDGSKLDKTNPSYQIIWYQQITGKTWGILTDGRYWRLYSTRAQSKYSTYYEVNVEKFLGDREDEQFKYFFNFFRRAAFVKEQNSAQSFLDVLFESGEHYAREVETRLKARAFHLVELICQGFSSDMKDPTDADLKLIYNHSLYYLFRLMFILNCEAKGLLSVHKQSDYFPHSLRALCGKIKAEHETNQVWSKQFSSYHHINDLFDLLVSGDEKIGIHGFGKEAFASGDAKFYKDNPIPNAYLNDVLLELAFAEDKKEKTLLFIDYKKLAADHLGSLFEGLLEFSLVKDGKANELVLRTSSGERKATGSYYTPQHVVDYVVAETLNPLVKDKSINEILELKVVDPAMGSGHFLLGTVRFLEEAILSRLSEQKDKPFDPQLVNWKVLHSCIHGVDINPLATELAKFSLWMHTAKNGYELEPLGSQLVCADSLLDQTVWTKAFATIKKSGGFDAVVGNPPYIRIQQMSGAEGESENIKNQFKSAAHGNFDVYVLFVEKALSIISDQGRVGFILPHKFMTAEYGAPLRKLLSSGKHVNRLLHFGDAQVFSAATTYTCLMFLSAKSNKALDFVKLSSIETFYENKFSFSKIENSSLGETPWKLGDGKKSTLIAKIVKQSKTLESYSRKIFVGLQTSADGVYVLKVIRETKTEYVAFSKALNEEVTLEKAITHPLLRGAEITRFGKPEKGCIVIFPYSVSNEKATGLTLEQLKQTCPKTVAYLAKNKPLLLKRSKVTEKDWWLYPYPKSLSFYGERKIISQVLSQAGKFFDDQEGVYYFLGGGTAGGNAIILNSTDERLYKLVLGILNSSVTRLYVSSVGSAFRGGFYAFGKNSLSGLPLPDLQLEGEAAKEIVKLVSKRESLKNSDSALTLEREINRAVGRLYGFTKSELALLLSEEEETGAEDDIRLAA